MLENHGVVIGGRDLREAFQRFETLEFVAQTLVKAAALGAVHTLPAAVLERQPLPGFGRNAGGATGQPREGVARATVRICAARVSQRLLISTAGAFSARLEGNDFLVTPRRRDRLELEAPGIVRARPGFCEAGKRPSRAALSTRISTSGIPTLAQVINAQPAQRQRLSALTKAALSSNTIPGELPSCCRRCRSCRSRASWKMLRAWPSRFR